MNEGIAIATTVIVMAITIINSRRLKPRLVFAGGTRKAVLSLAQLKRAATKRMRNAEPNIETCLGATVAPTALIAHQNSNLSVWRQITKVM
jgi:hypothetical protein